MPTFIKIRDLRVNNFGPLVMDLPRSRLNEKSKKPNWNNYQLFIPNSCLEQ